VGSVMDSCKSPKELSSELILSGASWRSPSLVQGERSKKKKMDLWHLQSKEEHKCVKHLSLSIFL
jgi:hypothetical protein